MDEECKATSGTSESGIVAVHAPPGVEEHKTKQTCVGMLLQMATINTKVLVYNCVNVLWLLRYNICFALLRTSADVQDGQLLYVDPKLCTGKYKTL